MAASNYTPLPPNSYYWDTTVTAYQGAPVVLKGSGNPYMVTNPAGTAADVIVGIAEVDAGPSVPSSEAEAANITVMGVQEYGVARCYAKGTIHAGNAVKCGPTISITPAGYSAAITVYTVQASTQTAAGSQPFPIVGFAVTESSADGDIVYVRLTPGVSY